MLTSPASGLGLSFGDPYALGLLFLGVVFCAGIAALSHQHERAFSASIIYLLLGLAASFGIHLLGGRRIDPIADAELVERVAEIALVVAIFTAGLKVERRLGWREWRSVMVLLGVVLPVTITLIAVFAVQVMGLSVGAAIVLGAALAATDPVLAGDIGIGAPGEQSDDPEEARFAVSAEAGLNDGLAFPFLLLGFVVLGGAGASTYVEWALTDVLYAVPVGGLVGGLAGYGLAALVVPLRHHGLFDDRFDAFVALAAPLLIYGAAEALGAYGLLAGFAGGLAFRRYEFGHEYNRRVHDGAEMAEKFLELAVILLLGTMVTVAALDEPGLTGWLLAPVLLLVIRPAVVLSLFARQPVTSGRERRFIAWFGVRGVAALYYVTFAVEAGVLAPGEESTVVWTAFVCVAVSIMVHGLTGTPLSRRVDEDAGRPAQEPARRPAGAR